MSSGAEPPITGRTAMRGRLRIHRPLGPALLRLQAFSGLRGSVSSGGTAVSAQRIAGRSPLR